ncbi:hypothetical protein OROMI_028574 [Orobanche minor]
MSNLARLAVVITMGGCNLSFPLIHQFLTGKSREAPRLKPVKTEEVLLLG